MVKRNAKRSAKEPKTKIAKINDNRLLLFDFPISLKDMAAIKVALALWYHEEIRYAKKKVSHDDSDSDSDSEEEEEEEEYDHWMCRTCISRERQEEKKKERVFVFTVVSLEVNVKSSLKALSLPASIATVIKKFIKLVPIRIEEWIKYQHERTFFEMNSEVVYRYVDEIIWNSDGTINDIGTAKNMLSSPRITKLEKYRIMCTFCFENDIKNVSPLLFTNKYFDVVTIEDHPLIYYWNCFYQGYLNDLLTDDRMLSFNNVDNKYAIMYFFNRLSEEKKLTIAKDLIRHYEGKYQKDLLNNLNELQQYDIFKEMCVDIVINFVKSSNQAEHALTTWIHVRNLASENQFCKIVGKMLNLSFSNDHETYSHVISILTSMWKNTPDHFKHHAIEHEERKVVNEVLENTSKFSDDKFEFLIEVLSDASADVKKQVMQSVSCSKFCEWLIVHSRQNLLIRLVQLCLPEKNDALEFKNQLLKTEVAQRHCIRLCIDQKLDDINEIFSNCLRDQRAVDAYTEQMLKSEKGIAAFVNELRRVDVAILKNTICKILPQPNAATNFMRTIGLSNAAIELFSSLIKEGEFNKVKDCVNHLLPNENDRKTVKDSVFGYYRGEEIIKLFTNNRTKNVNLAQEFLLWCLNNQPNVEQFKRTLPFRNIFIKMLQQSIFTTYDRSLTKCRFRYNPSFIELDRFLHWYFGSHDGAKKFKIQQIFLFESIEMINTLLRKKDKTPLKQVVNWFFGGDVQEIQKFKAKFYKTAVLMEI